MENDSLLGYALLGLIHQQPMSGYDLRKIFSSTAMGSFSDSPGAIYPALRRLEERGLVRGKADEAASRNRRVFHMTTDGQEAFKAWLKQPVTRDDVIRRTGDLMLRFAFMDQALGAKRAIRFLSQFAEETADYIPILKQYLESHASEMPLSGRLALECGIQEYETRLRWANASMVVYEQKRKEKK